jgi:transposase
MPRLLQNERERAVGMFQAGMTQTEIANHFNCCVDVLTPYLWEGDVNGDQTDATDYELFGQKFCCGMTHTEIANNFNCSIKTVYRLLVRVRATSTTSDRRRSGRLRETTLRQDRHITLIHLRHRFVTAMDTARRV